MKANNDYIELYKCHFGHFRYRDQKLNAHNASVSESDSYFT